MKHEKKYKWYKIAHVPAELIFGENNLAEYEEQAKKYALQKPKVHSRPAP